MPLTNDQLRAWKLDLDKQRSAGLPTPKPPTRTELSAYWNELRRAREGSAGIVTPKPLTSEELSAYEAELERARRAGTSIMTQVKPKSLLGPLFNAAPEPEPTKSLFASSTPKPKVKPKPADEKPKPNPNNYDFSPPKYGSYVPRYPPGATPVSTLTPPRPGDVIPKPYDPNLGGYPGYATPISGIGRGSPVAPTARGQRPLTERANTGLVPFVDPYQARPMYGQRDPVTGQYELLGWNTLAGGQRELPQKHWLSEDYANRFRNPLAEGSVASGFIEDNPRAGISLLSKGMPSPNAQGWLTRQFDRLYNDYLAATASGFMGNWAQFLGNLDLGQEYQNASRFERGERPGSLVPFARRLGY